MKTKSAQAWTIIAVAVALALVIAIHGLLVQVDFDACFENFVNSVSPAEPRLARVGEMSLGELVRASLATMGGGDVLLFGVGLLPLCPFLFALWSAETPRTARLWTISAVVVSALIAGYYGQSISRLFSGSNEFHDCDRKGLSIAIGLAPIVYLLMNVLIVSLLSFSRWLVRSLSPTG